MHKSFNGILAMLFVVVPVAHNLAQPDVKKPEAAKPADESPKSGRRAELEKQFQERLTEATLEGIWQMTGKSGLAAEEPLSEPLPDRYEIASVAKILDDFWVINARIQYGDRDVTVPITVRVVWVEDTPVITLDDLSIPLIGTYSARVIIHRNFYSGTWLSNENNYGGILAGRIRKSGDAPPAAKPQSETDASLPHTRKPDSANQ